MDMVPVDFDGGRTPAPITQPAIDAAFGQRGVRPPADYVAFASANGGKRWPSADRFIAREDTGEVITLGTVYHYDAGLPLYSVQDVWEQTRPQLPDPLLVPIASTAHGGQVCLDFRAGKSNPAVVVYDYEAIPGEEVGELAPSFAEFLKRIGPNPEA